MNHGCTALALIRLMGVALVGAAVCAGCTGEGRSFTEDFVPDAYGVDAFAMEVVDAEIVDAVPDVELDTPRDTSTVQPDTTAQNDVGADAARDPPTNDTTSEPDAVVEDTNRPVPQQLETLDGDRVRYMLAWDWEEATVDDAHGVHQFETDLGYTVGLEAGYVGSGQLEMVPCDGGAQRVSPSPWWTPLLRPRQALADHSVNVDPSRVIAPVAESVFASEPQEFGSVSVPQSSYCQLHYLIVPTEETSSDGFQMQRWSAYIRGWYQAPDSEERVPFETTVNLRGGAVVTMIPAQPFYGASSNAEVTLYRYPSRGFDGVAMDQVSNVELAYQFLLNIGRTTHVEFGLDAP